MREAIHFSYGGVYSTDMGLINVNIGDGMLEEPFLPNRQIKEISIRGKNKPYFQEVVSSPLSFPVSFAFQDRYNEKKIREIARWLSPDYYKPFFTTDNLNRVWFCMPIEDSILVHNSLKQGYVELTMRCDSPYTYSQLIISPEYDFSNVDSLGYPFSFDNLGDKILKPEMWITKIDNGDISIVNTTNGNKEFKFVDLIDGENLYISNENEFIKTDLTMVYRYDYFNNQFLEFVVGKNNLVAYGNFKMKLRYRFTTLQG